MSPPGVVVTTEDVEVASAVQTLLSSEHQRPTRYLPFPVSAPTGNLSPSQHRPPLTQPPDAPGRDVGGPPAPSSGSHSSVGSPRPSRPPPAERSSEEGDEVGSPHRAPGSDGKEGLNRQQPLKVDSNTASRSPVHSHMNTPLAVSATQGDSLLTESS